MTQPIIIASVYMDITLTVESPRLMELLEYAASRFWGLLMAMDTSAHSELYGPDQNARGTMVEDLLLRHNLHLENIGTTPTFQTSQRQSCIDVTVTLGLRGRIADWQVDTAYNASDHHSICFVLQFGFEYVPPIRPWARADWTKFQEILRDCYELSDPQSVTQPS